MLQLRVSGMNCGTCVKKITQAIKGLDENARVYVELKASMVRIDGVNSNTRFKAALETLGYGVTSC